MTTDIDAMEDGAAAAAQALVGRLIELGIRHRVTSTRRTVDEQLALFSQGRANLEVVNLLRRKADMAPIGAQENGYTVTKCDGVTKRSAHQDGRAVDIVPVDDHGRPTWAYAAYAKQYLEIGKVARGMGWTCGMDWPPISPVTGLGADPPHHKLG